MSAVRPHFPSLQQRSLDLELFLELDARAPIVLRHLVLEVQLQRIDTVSRDQRHDIGLIVEVTSVGHRTIVGNLHCDTASVCACEGHGFLVRFDGEHRAKSQIFAVGDAKRRSWLQDALDDVETDDDWIGPVEAGVGDHIADAREDGLGALACLALTLALLLVLDIVVLQMVDDPCFEQSDAILICKLLSIGHNLHIKGQQASVLFFGNNFSLGQVLHGFEHVLFVHRSNVHRADRDLRLVQELEESLK